jgi:hypothetical protein
MKKHQPQMPVSTNAIALTLSRNLSFAQRAQFVIFAENATIGHWAEVIHAMRLGLVSEHRCPEDGEPESHR